MFLHGTRFNKECASHVKLLELAVYLTAESYPSITAGQLLRLARNDRLRIHV